MYRYVLLIFLTNHCFCGGEESRGSESGSGSGGASGESFPHQIGYTGRVINGEQATPHSWPWQISLEKDGGHTCGGSLITPTWVVTAAHCIAKAPIPNRYRVVVGLHALGKASLYSSRHRVKEIIKHSKYDPKVSTNDIALLKLDQPVAMNLGVATINLPRTGTSPPPGWMCIVTGWGSTYAGSPSSPTLQQAEIPIVDHAVCAKRNGHIFPVVERQMICAGGNGKGGCHGDSGGPLVCNEIGKWFLRGVVSWGDERCRVGFYSVFTRVSNYLDWINNKLGAGGGGHKETDV